MVLALATHWVWDFWLTSHEGRQHLFYLQAPRSLGREELRHWHATIGHAVSSDLKDWEVLPEALGPGAPGSWDDLAVWTGSIIRHASRWWMLYTGVRRADAGLVQRIGLAVSEDLLRWERHPANPVLEADPLWYEHGVPPHWHDQAWRDPFLLRHPVTGTFHAFITARGATGPVRGRGVIAHAQSTDLQRWEVLPPVTERCDRYGQLEVPQVVCVDDRWLLLFSRSSAYDEPTAAAPTTGTHFYTSDDPLGPYTCATEGVLVADQDGTSYSGKLVRHTGRWWFLACSYRRGKRFIGTLADPAPLAFTDGRPALA